MSQSDTSGGIGFIGLLTILFIGLKLTKCITWSWIWVLSPLWIGPLAIITLLGLMFGAAGMMMGLAAILERRK